MYLECVHAICQMMKWQIIVDCLKISLKGRSKQGVPELSRVVVVYRYMDVGPASSTNSSLADSARAAFMMSSSSSSRSSKAAAAEACNIQSIHPKPSWLWGVEAVQSGAYPVEHVNDGATAEFIMLRQELPSDVAFDRRFGW